MAFWRKKGTATGAVPKILLNFNRKSACQGVCYGEDTCYDSHNDTADVWVLCLLVDQVADVSRERKNKNDWEEPDAHDTCDGVEEHLACCEELGVLCNNHDFWAEECEEHCPTNAASLTLSAALGVAIAVCRNAKRNVIHKPERKVKKDIRKVH